MDRARGGAVRSQSDEYRVSGPQSFARAGVIGPPLGTDFRSGSAFPVAPTVRCGDLELDRAERRAALAGRDLQLTDREFAVLAYLADRADHAVRYEELLSRIWTLQDETGANIVNVYVRRLRQKLGAQAEMLRTVRGFGYCLRSNPTI